VIGHAPHAVRPALDSVVFTAFHSGLRAACVAGAGVALVGALAAFRLMPGRREEAVALPNATVTVAAKAAEAAEATEATRA